MCTDTYASFDHCHKTVLLMEKSSACVWPVKRERRDDLVFTPMSIFRRFQ